jgi:Secretion system C-terminal sorting domain
MNKKIISFFKLFNSFLLILGSFVLKAQTTTIGFSGTVASGSAPSGSGPSTTPKVVTLHQGQANASTPGATFSPTTTVTFSLTNQQFTSIEGNPTIQGIEFGAAGNTSAAASGNIVSGLPLYGSLNSYNGSPFGTYTGNFTGCNTCTVGNSSTTATGDGVRYSTLGSVNAILFADALIQADGKAVPTITDVDAGGFPNLLGKFYYGDLTLTFNRPVSNPVLHVVDIGGRQNYSTLIGAVTRNYVLGFTTDYKLITPGLTLAKLSGSTHLAVTSDSIYNNSPLLGTPSNGETYAGETRAAASGSIVIQGTNITTVTFRLVLRGDGGSIRNSTGTTGSSATASNGNFVRWGIPGNFNPCGSTPSCTPAAINQVAGDYMQFAVGLKTPVNVSGHVWHDINGGNVNSSSATAIPTGIYANLIDATGKVVASQLVPSTGGSAGQFSFDAVGEGDYTVNISVTAGVQGASAPLPSLPAGWLNTGEFNGNANTGNDGIINGTSSSFTVASTNVIDRNFGIQRGPESAVNLQPSQVNPGSNTNVTVPAGAFQASNVGSNPNTQDYDGGTVTNIRLTSFPSNATNITVNGTTYTSSTFPAAGITVPYTNGIGPAQAITVDPIDGFVSVVIPFASIDNAGVEDPTPGSVTLPFTAISLAGNVWNDLNGNAATVGAPESGEQVINGTNAGGGILTGSVLHANLLDVNNVVIATVPIQSDGTYFFPNVPTNATLTVQLSTNEGTVGQPKPATTTPTGWKTTGENKNTQAGAVDVSPNSEIPVSTLTANITAQNFGLQQLPESAVHSQIIGLNPGSTISTAVNPSWFETSNVGLNPNSQDYNGGTVTNIRLTSFPSNATSITVNGTTYTSGTFPVAGITVPYINGTGPSQAIAVDPIDGFVTVVIPFASIDNAGQEDSTPGSVTLIYTSVLPVKFISISSLKQAESIQVKWDVGTEVDVNSYVVERSANGISFKVIGNVNASGNSAYQFEDSAPMNGTNYYRIKSVDNSGFVAYSSTIKVSSSLKTNIQIAPNPVGEFVTISGLSGKGNISILTIDGKQVDNFVVKGNVVTYNLRQLMSGMYIIQYIDNGKEQTVRMLKK